MKKRANLVLWALILQMVLMLLPTTQVAAAFTPTPKTPYATEFVQKCEGQQWFIDEVESQLNAQQKTISRLGNAADLDIIKSLGFANQNISGKIPAAIGEFRELQYLFLSGNRLGGVIPDVLYQLPKLRNIDISDNLYTESIPEKFGLMSALTHLDLSGNQYTGSIPATITSNGALVFLDIADNKLTGQLPGFSAMTGLEYLNVSQNTWGGTLPNVSGLNDLKVLSAWGCALTGGIPAAVYTLTDLQILDLAQNGLTGTISNDLGNLTKLQLLSLAYNKLEGEISGSVSGLVELEVLALADNRLRGTIPDAFSAATLAEIHLENNFLRGLVPATLKDRYDAGASVYLQNNYLTGTDLKDMTENGKNFADLASTEQYQLIFSTTPIRLTKDTALNIYPILKNRSYTSGNTTQKILLLPTEYALALLSGDAAKVTITSDASGIYVTAVDEILLADGFVIEISIKDNTGSNYAKTTVGITTEVAPSVGGGGALRPSEPSTSEVHNPYITGFPDGTFKALEQVSRAQVAAMVVRALEIEARTYYSSGYSDVERSDWAFSFIETATDRGFLQGYGDGLFGPIDSITRGELATCLVRIAESMGRDAVAAELTFSDVDSDAWYSAYVLKAARLGLVTGYEDGTFRPTAPVTRAEAVAMINRMLGRNPDTANELNTMKCPFPDVSATNWAYGHIMEASVKHNH